MDGGPPESSGHPKAEEVGAGQRQLLVPRQRALVWVNRRLVAAAEGANPGAGDAGLSVGNWRPRTAGHRCQRYIAEKVVGGGMGGGHGAAIVSCGRASICVLIEERVVTQAAPKQDRIGASSPMTA